jgi:uncharacterized damage-inducible protein DinB
MITTAFAQKMARYNAWQNDSLYAAADALTDEARRADRGAFFKSIHGALSHLLWADAMWMSRIGDGPAPAIALRESPKFCVEWAKLKDERKAMDARLLAFAEALDDAALEGDFSWYSGALQAQIVKPRKLIVVHIFNHQTHHRGQVHAMLTAAGALPQDTDLIFMP